MVVADSSRALKREAFSSILRKEFGIDAYEVADAIALDDRIGEQFLRSGVGWGEGVAFRKIQQPFGQLHATRTTSRRCLMRRPR